MKKKGYRAKEAAEYVGVALSTVWLFANQKKLHPVKISDRVTIFLKEDLDRFMESRSTADIEQPIDEEQTKTAVKEYLQKMTAADIKELLNDNAVGHKL